MKNTFGCSSSRMRYAQELRCAKWGQLPCFQQGDPFSRIGEATYCSQLALDVLTSEINGTGALEVKKIELTGVLRKYRRQPDELLTALLSTPRGELQRVRRPIHIGPATPFAQPQATVYAVLSLQRSKCLGR